MVRPMRNIVNYGVITRDRVRHDRVFQSSSMHGIANFPLQDSADPNTIGIRARDVFPLVSLNFVGGASMGLKPEEYLIQHRSFADGAWCVGFQKSQRLTILGELVLKDKIIVYDLAQQRLRWADYDCSSSVNVSLVAQRVRSSPWDADSQYSTTN